MCRFHKLTGREIVLLLGYHDLVALGRLLALPRHGPYSGRHLAPNGHEDIEESRLMHPAASATRVRIEEMGAWVGGGAAPGRRPSPECRCACAWPLPAETVSTRPAASLNIAARVATGGPP